MYFIKTKGPELSGVHYFIKTKVSVEVGLIAALVLVCCNSSSAATGSSWSPKSTWSGEDSSTRKTNRSQETKDIIAKDTRRDDVSPFAPGSHNLGIDLGQVFLMGGLTRFSDSIGAQLHYNYGVSDLFAFDSSVGYSEHSDGKYSLTSLLAGLRMNMSWYDRVIPYAVFGLGFYKPSFRETSASAPGSSGEVSSVSAVLFGLHLGPGIDLELSKNLYFGASLTFHNMFGSNGSPMNLGGNFTTFLIHAGVTF